jgi:hypothetical protein
MKCIRDLKTGKVVRMNDKAAHVLVSQSKAQYVAKHIWREEGRKR